MFEKDYEGYSFAIFQDIEPQAGNSSHGVKIHVRYTL